MVERDHPRLSLRRQCKLLGISRSTLNYKPVRTNPEDIEMMKFLKETYLKDPSMGSRKLKNLIENKKGKRVNRKRLQRLKRKTGLKTIYCRPPTSIPNEAHKKYPYLLKNRCIAKPNEAWCTDITYIPMPRGHVYLCCVMDWY